MDKKLDRLPWEVKRDQAADIGHNMALHLGTMRHRVKSRERLLQYILGTIDELREIAIQLATMED